MVNEYFDKKISLGLNITMIHKEHVKKKKDNFLCVCVGGGGRVNRLKTMRLLEKKSVS